MLKRKISGIIKEENYPYQEIYDIEAMINHFKRKAFELSESLSAEINTNDKLLCEIIEFNYLKFKKIVETLEDHEALLFHKNVAKCQRTAYNAHHKNPSELRNKILIEVDFKQKIVIGLSPRQVSSEYYNQVTRSCVGNVI